MANCPSCGGMMQFDIKEQKLKCKYCSNLFDPYQHDQVNHAICEKDELGVNVFSCPQCGGELISSDHDLSGKCSFCGSPVVFDVKMRKERMPKYIIPFQITKEDCKTKYMEALNECPFAPKELKDSNFIEGFRGIYVPYWFYSVSMEGEPFQVKGKYQYTKGNYDYTDTYELNGQNKAVYHEIVHDASSIFQDDISEQIEPFHFHDKEKTNLKPFTPSFFTGFYAEPVDVEPEVYHTYAKDVAETKSRMYLDEQSEFAKYKIASQLESRHFASEVTKSQLALMPVWFLSYRKNDRIAYAAINGQTGKMVSDLPIDLSLFFKYFLMIALFLFVGLNFFTILPKTVTMISIVISFFVARLCHDDVRLIVQRTNDQNRAKKRNQTINSDTTAGIFIGFLILTFCCKIMILIDDDMSILTSNFVYVVIGVIACFLELYYVFFSLKHWKAWISQNYYVGCIPILCLIASFYGTYILQTRPVQDEYYYAAALVVILITLLSFVMIILNYNKVATRPLPQFQLHTGGEENE